MSFLDNTGLAHLWSKITTALAGKLDVTGNAYRSASIPWGQVDSSSTSTVYTATVPGITELRSGVCVMLMNGVVTSESGFTVNINNLGAKPVYSTLAAASRSTTLFNINYTLMLVYNEERVAGGCWDAYYGYDSNTNTIGYQLRTNSTTMPTLDKFYRYRLLFTAADRQHLVPANTSSSTNATSSRTVNQRPIDPFGAIYYYGHTTAINANANPTASYFWTQYSFALGYSFNRTGSELTLTNHAPVYIKCAPQSDGSAIIDADTPYVQSLPTTNDGKIYIFLGVASSATAVELVPVHPVYYYNDGIKLWLGRQVYTKPSTGIPASDLAVGVIPDVSGKANSADLAAVATSGSYNDLSDKPTIPSAVTEQTVAGWGFTKNTGTYSKPSGGIPASDLAAGVIPTIPITSISVNGGRQTPVDGNVDITVPIDYVSSVDLGERTDMLIVQMSYSNGIVAIEKSGVPLSNLIDFVMQNCNVWFVLPTAYITGVQSNTDMMRFRRTGVNLDTSAPTVSLTSEYGGKVYHAVLSPVSEYRMEGQLQVLDYQTAQQVQTAIALLQSKAITDTGGYFTTDTVEGALQEIGAELAGINTLIGNGVIS